MKTQSLATLSAKASRYLKTAALNIENEYPQRAEIMQDLSKALDKARAEFVRKVKKEHKAPPTTVPLDTYLRLLNDIDNGADGLREFARTELESYS